MADYAQTNLQLYRQLRRAGYSDDDLVLVDRAYRIAMRVFAGQYRPNRKPFLAHLVGVAGILASEQQPVSLVAAGLLHSVYPLGLCRRGKRLKPAYRAALKAALGDPVEHLVHAYGARDWGRGDFSRPLEELRLLEGIERQLYLLKLADIHEEMLDGGIRYQPGKKLLADADAANAWFSDVGRVIAALGSEAWARDFGDAVESSVDEIPAELMDTAPGSYILAPGLHDRHWKNRLVQWLIRI